VVEYRDLPAYAVGVHLHTPIPSIRPAADLEISGVLQRVTLRWSGESLAEGTRCVKPFAQ
jgi:hypothetical protein